MGANSIGGELDGKMTQQQVQEHLIEAMRQSRIEDGTSYSGCIGMLTGVSFCRPTPPVFESVAEANNYLEEHIQKNECALVVRAKKTVKKLVKSATFEGKPASNWDRKAWQMTFHPTQRLVFADQLTAAQKAKAEKVIAAEKMAREACHPVAELFKAMVWRLQTVEAGGFDEYGILKKTRRQYAVLHGKCQTAKRALTELEAAYIAKLYKEKAEPPVEVWVWCGLAGS